MKATSNASYLGRVFKNGKLGMEAQDLRRQDEEYHLPRYHSTYDESQ